VASNIKHKQGLTFEYQKLVQKQLQGEMVGFIPTCFAVYL